MGDRLLLDESNNRQVQVPVRKANNQLAVETARLRHCEQVSVWYRPYTRRTIVTVTFRLLDNCYDWAEGFLDRNHETTFRDIFARFGFELPWHDAMFTVYAGTEGLIPQGGDSQQLERFAEILGHKPFVTMVTVPAGNMTESCIARQTGGREII